MELEIVSEFIKGKKVVIGFDLIPKLNIREEEKFCQNLFYGYHLFTIDDEEKKIIIESSEYGLSWDKSSFDISSKKVRKALKSILGNKRNYTIEITENNVFQLRIDKDRKMNPYPGSGQSRKNRKKLKRAKRK